MRRLSWPVRWAGILPGVESVSSPDAVYLTFDDGPSATTPRLLDVLRAEGIAATFFLLGREVERDPGAARAILAAGHSIGSHGEAHLNAWRVPGASAVADLARGTHHVEQTLGMRITRVRPPYGHLRPATVRWARAGGRLISLWSVMPGDFLVTTRPGAEARLGSAVGHDESAHRVARIVRPGDIIVLHEGLPGAAETALRTIESVRAALPGVRFAPLT